MKELLNAFIKSLYDQNWLKKQRQETGKAWTYFVLFIFVFSIVVAVPTSLSARPVIKIIQKEFSSRAPDFKAELVKGKLIVDRAEQPYVLQIPEEKIILVVDTKNMPKRIEDYVSTTFNTGVLIGSEEVVVTDNVGMSTKSQKWPSDASFTLTKQDVEGFFSKFLQPAFYFGVVFVVFIALFVSYFVSKLYSVLVVSLVVYVSAKLSGKTYSWKELFVMSLYAVTLPSLISLAFYLTGAQFQYIHFIALLAFMLAAVFTENKTKKTRIK